MFHMLLKVDNVNVNLLIAPCLPGSAIKDAPKRAAPKRSKRCVSKQVHCKRQSAKNRVLCRVLAVQSGKQYDKPRARRVNAGAVSVMVQRRFLKLCHMCDDSGAYKFRVMPLVVPLFHMEAKTAGAIRSALCRSDVGEVASKCQLLWDLEECDHASANEAQWKQYRHHLKHKSELPKNRVRVILFCFLHQVHLVSGLLLTLPSDGTMFFISAMYSACNLLRTPGYFHRMLDVVKVVVRRLLDVRTRPPPHEARERSGRVLFFLGIDINSPLFQNLLNVLNGFWGDGRLVHHCTGPECCEGGWETTAYRVEQLLLYTVFAHVPDVPMPSRWTRVVTSLSWFALGFFLHDIVTQVYLTAFDPLHEPEKERACVAQQKNHTFVYLLWGRKPPKYIYEEICHRRNMLS
jgi:hypothetical protein